MTQIEVLFKKYINLINKPIILLNNILIWKYMYIIIIENGVTKKSKLTCFLVITQVQ